jgi:hypothetical protein
MNNNNLKTLVFLGLPRTGTCSFYYMIKHYKEIAESKIKEPFVRSIYRDIFPRNYMNEFKITNKTKILFDCTPAPYFYNYNTVKKIQKEYGFDIKIIYPVRNPFDRIYSNIKLHLVLYKDFYHTNGILDIDKILKFISEFMLYSISLKFAYKITNDVFIFRFDEWNMNEIFNFIGIEYIDNIKMDKINSFNVFYTDEYKKVREQLDYCWSNNFKKIAEIILIDLQKIKDKVYVEDWIKQAENILRG